MHGDSVMTLQDEKVDSNREPYSPRPVIIIKGKQGFGFNVRGQIDEGGQLKSINGHLYPPLQHISNVIHDGPAAEAGVLVGDRILEVNGEPVEGESHARVIELIKKNPEKLRMVLMSVPPKENDRLDGEAVSYCSDDDFDRKPIDITIPNISQKEENGSKYVSYNVYLNGKFICSHRYKAFSNLQSDLKVKFFQFEFPKFPGKWPFQLSQSQLEKRHKELEQWLTQICSVTQLFDHFYMQDFLGLTTTAPSTGEISTQSLKEPENADVKVTLPNKTISSVNIPADSDRNMLTAAICASLNIPSEFTKYFCIYKSYNSDDFEVPLKSSDKPCELFVQSYNESQVINFSFKKFLFSTEVENMIAKDDAGLNFLYQQAVNELNNKCFDTEGKEIELKRTQHPTTQLEFLKIAHTCTGYNNITFPHCLCDSRRDGHVLLCVSHTNISIQACSISGVKEAQIKNFNWSNVSDFGLDGDVFYFTITKNTSERKISLKSPFADYMSQCFEKIYISDEA